MNTPMVSPGSQGLKPGQEAYDPVSGRVGVLQAVHGTTELLFDPKVSGKHIAFLRPVGGGVEWTANADELRAPEEAERSSGRDTPSP